MTKNLAKGSMSATAGTDGLGTTPKDVYPTFNLHDLRHVTDKKSVHYGKEVGLDPVPMQPPTHYKRPPSLIETVREQIRAHHRLAAEAEMDSLEEADDFEMDDDANDPSSRYENDFEPSLRFLRENKEKITEYMKELEQQPGPPRSGGSPATSSAPQAQTSQVPPEPTPPPSGGSAQRGTSGETPPPPPSRRLW